MTTCEFCSYRNSRAFEIEQVDLARAPSGVQHKTTWRPPETSTPAEFGPFPPSLAKRFLDRAINFQIATARNILPLPSSIS